MAKCDFCEKEATCYGSQQCYLACDDHSERGEEIERRMWDMITEEEWYEMQRSPNTKE